jgi:nucleoid DNA-binding protein
MMDELINMVAQRTGLGPDKAKTAIDTVVGFLKTKLPAPLAEQLDSALAGGGGAGLF